MSGVLARLSCLLVFLLAAPAAAQVISSLQQDSSLPLRILADRLELLEEERRAVFTGAVDAVQGDLRLNADRLVVHYRDGPEAGTNEIYLAEASGNVRFITPTETATGREGVYRVETGLVDLEGDVVLTRPDEAVIRGEKLTMDLNTGVSEVTGGRVDSLFLPAGDDS